MDDPVKGEGRMITDANGITRREGGISGLWGNMFNDSNGVKADSPPLIPDIRDILDVFPQSLRESLVNKISEAIDYEPVIGVMGKTGAGKSSVCNALFQGEVCAVSDVEACTREAQALRIRFGKRSLKIIDIPGVGENARRDKEYEDLYRTLLPSLDLILWVIKGDDRAFSADEHFYNNVLLPAGGGSAFCSSSTRWIKSSPSGSGIHTCISRPQNSASTSKRKNLTLLNVLALRDIR